uniref:Uncharacterized protein n=1 Tax=Medicago truncatula TaxID=3880 RepID=Q1SKW2_MEDTR|nr:hypothetical protein MtrDRAFT_AC140550g30v2 [Medicago truncatula]
MFDVQRLYSVPNFLAIWSCRAPSLIGLNDVVFGALRLLYARDQAMESWRINQMNPIPNQNSIE